MKEKVASTKDANSTRERILVLLKQNNGATAAELADKLGITSMGVRRHLMVMERDGLVRHEQIQRGLGRPSYIYALTPMAHDLFPKNYWQLTNELLAYVELFDGPGRVHDLFKRRSERRIQQAQQRLAGRPLEEQVLELSRILDEDGYLAECEQIDEDTWFIREHNCAVHHVAERYHQICHSELDFIQTVLTDAEVRREHHIQGGDSYCGYLITRRMTPPADAS